jgi:hypothetical protein
MAQTFEFLLEVNDDGRPRVTVTRRQGSMAGKPQEIREYNLGCKFPGDDFEMTAQASPAGVMFVQGRNEQPSASLLQRMGVGRKK